MKQTAAVIFCGGNSVRMNFPKAFLRYNGYTLLEEAVIGYRNTGIEKVYAIVNKRLLDHPLKDVLKNISKKCKLIINEYPERGRTYSVSMAAKKIEKGSICFLQNIDNPVPRLQVLNQMLDLLLDDEEYVVPRIHETNGHPVLAGRSVMKHLSDQKGLKWNLRDELQKFKKVILPLDDETLLLNFNTPEDWNAYNKIL
jgi:CTP:molybdopterin cytidylyltransferase MocA